MIGFFAFDRIKFIAGDGTGRLIKFLITEGKKMKKVITYGTYDLLHVGHINLLRRAKELGDYLIVVLSSDEFNAIKGKKAYHSYEDRRLFWKQSNM